MGGTILIADDEKKIREFIGIFLKAEKFNVLEAEDGQTAIDICNKSKVDLIILDIMLPDYNGYEVCRKIREISDVPIIFLTAVEDDDYHLLGYNSGADDYMVKPCKASILVAKVKRLIERCSGAASEVCRTKGLTIDKDGRILIVDGERINLTPKEFDLLLVLVQNKGKVLTRNYLLETIWGYDFEGESRVVDNHIKKLRKKLGKYAYLIKTSVSVGYKFEE